MTVHRHLDAEHGSAMLRDAILRCMGKLPQQKRARRKPNYVARVWWSEQDIRKLSSLADARLGSAAIAKALGRTPVAVRAKACKLGISLNRHKVRRSPRPADISQWSEADKIAEWADVPQELAEMVIAVCAARNLDPSDVRSESRAKDLVNCRKAISVAARELGYSFPKIARALNKDHTSVIYFVNSPESTISTGCSTYVPCGEQGIVAA